MRIHGGNIGVKKSHDVDYRFTDYVKLRIAGLGIQNMRTIRLAIAKLNKKKL